MDFVGDDVTVTETTPAPFLWARRLGAAATMLALLAVVPLIGDRRPVYTLVALGTIGSACVKVAYPKAARRERRGRVRSRAMESPSTARCSSRLRQSRA